MTAAIALKPVLVSMASEISEMMLPASAATTVAPRMQSVPALHKMRTKPAAALTLCPTCLLNTELYTAGAAPEVSAS